MLIGISGKKQSGKSTIAQYLIEQGCVGILCFADKIKEIVRDLFFEPEEDYIDLDSEAGKQTVLRCGWTPRELLQIVGTDLFRSLYRDVWINAFKNQMYLVEHYPVVVVPDVRFENEVEFIHSMGGKVIRLTRQPFPDQHESETALDWLVNETEAWQAGYNTEAVCDPIKLHFDAIIDNADMGISEQCQTAESLISGWISAQKANDCAQ